jgi:hypothetical protein
MDIIERRCNEFVAMVCDGAMEQILKEAGRIWESKHPVKKE